MDDDLLNEGNRRLRDYYQSLGYFDVKVDHTPAVARNRAKWQSTYNVQPGSAAPCWRVSVDGNHYFDAATLEELLSVHAANLLESPRGIQPGAWSPPT